MSDSFLRQTLDIAQLVEISNDVEAFKEYFDKAKNQFNDVEGVEGLIRALTHKYLKTTPDLPLEELLPIVYQNKAKGQFEALYFKLTQGNNTSVEDYIQLLPDAYDDESRLRVLTFMLRCYLMEGDQERIKTTLSEIKKLCGDL